MTTLVPDGAAAPLTPLDAVTPRLACRDLHARVASAVSEVLTRPSRGLTAGVAGVADVPSVGSVGPRGILPDNLAALTPAELSWAVEVSAAGGFAMAWAPAIDVVRGVLACRTAAERDDVLLDRSDDVLDDCLTALRAPSVDVPVDTLVPVRLAQRAVEAAQSGCVEAASALATYVLDVTFADGKLTTLAHAALRDAALPAGPEHALRRWRLVLGACALPGAEELYGGSPGAAAMRLRPADPFAQRRLEAVKAVTVTTSWVRLLVALATESTGAAWAAQPGSGSPGRPSRKPCA